MRIIALKILRMFWEKHSDAEQTLKAWYTDAKTAQWTKPTDITEVYASASILRHNRTVFNVRGNKYRLVVAINYQHQIIYIRFIGTHQEYSRIDATTI
jgi:mRNA interferase HigB